MNGLRSLKEMSRVLFLCFLGISSFCHASESSQEISKKIQALKDPSLSDTQKWDISREIQKEGKPAIPSLIGCVKDSTPIAKTPLTGGECVNLPVTATPPPQCKNPVRNETLGERCESLLYHILTPAYNSPHMTPLTSKQAPPPPFVIPDWNSWWEIYQSKSLRQIHQEARKKIDEFWKKGHQTSVVWKD